MDAGIEGSERGWAAVEVPVHAIRGGTIGAGLFRATAAVDEATHHADFADLAIAEEAVGIDVVRADAAVESDLDGAAGILAVRTMARLSLTVWAVGFSTKTWAPALRAAMVWRACQWSGVAMMAMSGFSLSRSSR
jgi:hypothetical protein